jgi:DNA gyrase subunit A
MASQGELLPFAREVLDVPVSEELGDSFLAYSLSVITSRAIPDVRDGLKPVQRRILYSMREMRLFPDRSHRKCAHVVGDVMARFHPHGDSAIYDTLVRLGQDFSRPVTLIDPQGNFGSLDDPPAAYRYTECRLTNAALDLLAEIDEETVEFRLTYDGEGSEPAYLPALLPNLLVNGTSGIAVGMATNMAPHNLREVYEAIKLVMTKRRPRPTIDELLAVLPGPDFPTGAIVIDDDLRSAYETGRGTLRIRATAEVVDVTRHRQGLVFTELPYLVGVERVVGKIKELVNGGRINGIANVTNLSDRTSGLRLVVECKTGVNPQALLEQLYKLTPLEETFGINNVVLVDGVPTTLGLYDLCRYYIDHRLDMVIKRTEFRLRTALDRLHLVEGLLIAIDNIDLVISIIRSSTDSAEARGRLMNELTLSETQAEYVLELRLRRLTALAYDELVAEKVELAETIDDLEKLLASEQRQRTIVIRELAEVVEKYGTARRTRIIGVDQVPHLDELEEAVAADLPDDPCIVSLSSSGLAGREPMGTSKSYAPGRHDVIDTVVVTTLRSKVTAITSSGRALSILADDVPEVGGRSRGREAGEVFAADRGENILAIAGATTSDAASEAFLLVSAHGMVKRLERSALAELTSGRAVMKLADRDRLIAVVPCGEADEVVLVASDAQALRTPVDGISIQGPAAKGVAGMSLKGNARVVGAGLAQPGAVVVSVTDTGSAKSTTVDEVPSKGRGGGGVRLTKFKDEQRLDYAWVGIPDRIMAVVGQTEAPTKPDNAPEAVALRPSRRDGVSTPMPRRILQIGTLRW